MPFSKMAGASSASSSLRRQNASEQLGLSDSGSPPGKGPRIDLGDIAKKVPQVKRSGDEAKYASDCLTRNAFVRAVELMERNPHVIMECWAWLDTKVNGQSGANDNQVWDKCVTHWSKVPKYWLAQFLYQNYPDVMSEEMLEQIDRRDRDAIRHVFSIVCMIMPSDVVPKAMRDKRVMSRVLINRVKKIGLDLTKVLNGIVDCNYEVGFTRGVPYGFVWDEKTGFVKEVYNMFGERHHMEAHEIVTGEFEFSYAYDFRAAVLHKGANRMLLYDLFESDSLIKQWALCKKAKQLEAEADVVAAEFESAWAAQRSSEVDESRVVLKDSALKESRKRAAEKARLHQQESAKKRAAQVDLSMIAPVRVLSPAPILDALEKEEAKAAS